MQKQKILSKYYKKKVKVWYLLERITYSEVELQIVEAGIGDVSKVLLGGSALEKERLLFCLDRFLDPWFGCRLPYENDLLLLLQQVLINENELYVKESCVQLLGDYAWPPFPILTANKAKIEQKLQGEIEYLLHMNAD